MRPHDRGVDHLHFVGQGAALVQRLQHQLPHARKRPAPKLPIDRRPFAEIAVQVAPGNAGARDPEHTVEHTAMILRRPPALRARGQNKRREKRPLPVAHQAANQDRLPKSSLESHPGPLGNPLCQQGLVDCNSRQLPIGWVLVEGHHRLSMLLNHDQKDEASLHKVWIMKLV